MAGRVSTRMDFGMELTTLNNSMEPPTDGRLAPYGLYRAVRRSLSGGK
jgi:hypothetical protein